MAIVEIDQVMEQAWKAFTRYRQCSLKERADLLRAIAKEIEDEGDALIEMAMRETNLPDARLRGERGRTIFQLNSYALACERGNWMDVRIDTAIPTKVPPKPDIRKMQIPLGPVVVFGASNFPFAYSTAGGDTACALAAGCPVIVKAHPAHAGTSEMVAKAIHRAVNNCGLPAGVFSHVSADGFESGAALVAHPYTKAVGFTGSFSGGKALFDIAAGRKEPIPVFSEMGSINPVFLLEDKMRTSIGETAKSYAASITLSAGQFCTNPGLLVAIDGPDLKQFITALAREIEKVSPAKMLHPGIAKAYTEKRILATSQAGVAIEGEATIAPQINEALPTITSVAGDIFLKNPVLHQEVFGPYSLVVRCKDLEQMREVASRLEGQLTCTVMATEEDIRACPELIDTIGQICGRLVLNGVPTGVEVCLSMQHGGPFPATTDSRYTSVGADGIKRFARPLAFQNWPDSLLPAELKNSNPLNIWRTVNDVPTQAAVEQ